MRSSRYPRTSALPIVLLASMTTINGALTLSWSLLRPHFAEAAPVAWTALAALWTLQAATFASWLHAPLAAQRRARKSDR